MEVGQKVKIVDYHNGEFDGLEGEITKIVDHEKYPFRVAFQSPDPEVVSHDGKFLRLIPNAIVVDGVAYHEVTFPDDYSVVDGVVLRRHTTAMREGEFEEI